MSLTKEQRIKRIRYLIGKRKDRYYMSANQRDALRRLLRQNIRAYRIEFAARGE